MAVILEIANIPELASSYINLKSKLDHHKNRLPQSNPSTHQ